MNVAYSSSDFYFKPTLVSACSLLENSSEPHRVILLASKVSASNCDLFCEEVTKRGGIPEILDIDDVLEEKAREMNLPLMRGNYSTYARLFLAEILVYDSVLLVDSDTLVLGDVSAIASEVKCQQKPINVCRDFVISNKHSRHEDKFLSERPYYNMGVVFLDLNVWRKLKLTSLVRDNFDLSHQLMIADQSIFNKYLLDYMASIPIKYNWYSYFYYNFNFDEFRQKNNSTQFLSKTEFDEARQSPVVLHFIGNWFERPWYRQNLCPHADVYKWYWTQLFASSDLYATPRLNRQSIYSFTGYLVRRFLGDRFDYLFRYVLIQKLKVLL